MEWVLTLNHIQSAAEECWNLFPHGKVFAFQGNMGAGKTTFIRALCRVKGVTSVVGSPTFSIINEYESPEGPLFHIDLYRLKDLAEIRQAGVEDCLYSGEICLVEWADKAVSILPADTVWIYITIPDRETRKISAGTSSQSDPKSI